LLYTVKEKGGNPDRKPYPLPYGLRNLYKTSSLRLLFLQTHTVSTVQLLYTAKDKGGKPDRKPYPLHYGLINPYTNLKSENSQEYAQKHQQNCTFMNSASVKELRELPPYSR
jgi:hypothetical protein